MGEFKSCHSFTLLGPCLLTTDEMKDVNNLAMWFKVNGEIMQQGNTINVIVKVAFIVSYISQFLTLLHGNIISTGIHEGVV
jgi:2-keto-4-pentenoate hydratase/2-oxohepta-3-ene-1,7-dioic acid hydratase in catechol pathway